MGQQQMQGGCRSWYMTRVMVTQAAVRPTSTHALAFPLHWFQGLFFQPRELPPGHFFLIYPAAFLKAP